ncbi:hypothetical protein [Arthrobacter globiformis]|uniref:hypothetical protein n=1 Tax=Arthrobacter globiformis TaxID=1665 RepID=UPI002793770F|nr:hypothetical protein [Arthrobacter globiformis]
MGGRWVFDGHIAGIGTGSGLRAVVGIWQESPFGPFADAMVQLPTGRRVLLAPTDEVAEFIAATYSFEEVRVVDVSAVLAGLSWTVDAGPLALRAIWPLSARWRRWPPGEPGPSARRGTAGSSITG